MKRSCCGAGIPQCSMEGMAGTHQNITLQDGNIILWLKETPERHNYFTMQHPEIALQHEGMRDMCV